MPGMPDPNGLPDDVQIIGDLFSEDRLLGLAQDFEAAGPGWKWPDYISM
jgi:Asp-tRNA(Asn)/Glu-tRNA(Gln) amidotransferase A subunit family amidase